MTESQDRDAIWQRSGLQNHLDDEVARDIQQGIQQFLDTEASQLRDAIDAGTQNLSAPLRAYARRLLR